MGTPHPAIELPTFEQLVSNFPSVHYADWRAAAESALRDARFEGRLVTHTPEGIDIAPLYTGEVGAREIGTAAIEAARSAERDSIVVPRSAGWRIEQRYDHPDPDVANRQIREDLGRGAGGVWLRLDRAARLGIMPGGRTYAAHAGAGGGMIATLEDIERALDAVPLGAIHVAFDAGAAAISVTESFGDLVKRRGLDAGAVRVAFGVDPLGTLAAEGRWPGRLAADREGDLAGELGDFVGPYIGPFPHVRVLGVSALPYHAAGANAVQELAYALATAAVYLRALARFGYDAVSASRQLRFVFGVGSDAFTEIAKLRAARRLWARVLRALGDGVAAEAGPMVVHAVTSPRTLARRDPWVNLARATAQAAAAAIGGADSVTTLPFDAVPGPAGDLGRRLAINTGLILQAECHLHRIADAAGGSPFAEHLTDQLARRAWAHFQGIERDGGMIHALTSGRAGAEVAAAAEARRAALAGGSRVIVGVTRHPPPQGLPVPEIQQPDLEALRAATIERFNDYVARHPNRTGFDWPRPLGWADAESGRATTIQPLPIGRDAEPFEEDGDG